MRVNYDWNDSSGYEYNISAEIGQNGRIHIVRVVTHDGIELDFHDDENFTDDERKDVLWLAKEAGDDLEHSEDPLCDDEDEDSEETNLESY